MCHVTCPFVKPTCCLDDPRLLFEDFVAKYGRKYANESERLYRFGVFKDSLTRVRANNEDEPDKPFGITKFSDWTPDEFKSRLLRYQPDATVDERSIRVYQYDRDSRLPAKYDWRDHSPPVVSNVKNQGACGSCWAFSAVENVESIWALQGNHTLVNLSVQQVVDCDTVDSGCGGGDTKTAFRYIHKHGLELASSYPYTASDSNCKFQSNEVVAHIDGYEFATRDEDEHAMQAYLVNKAPLSICVDASSWQDYSGGILTRQCGRLLDHCVMITGYDTVSSHQPYWIIRNSWGETWGEEGYLRVVMFEDKCGLAQEATSSFIST